MVLIEEVNEEPPPPAAMEVEEVEIPPSQERLLDAEAIEQAAANMERLSAKLQLESLAKKLRKESAALKRVEESRAKMSSGSGDDSVATTAPQAAAEPTPTAAKVPAVAPQLPSHMYSPIDKFSFDAGSYGSAFVTVYVPLPSVGSIPKDNITCIFTATSFDLIVKDLNGKSYRLYKDNLDKDIDPEKSKYIVKADKVVIKLAKVKSSDYGSYDMWTDLTAKKKKKDGAKKDDPQAAIMDLMKDMYDSGDADMKKMIGETMLKQRRGELDKGPMDMGGM